MKDAWKLGYLTVALAGALALGACGSDGPNTDTAITQGQASVVGAQVADQAGAIASALGEFQLSTGGLGQGFFAPATPGARILSIVRHAAGPRAAAMLFRAAGPEDCNPGVTGDSADTDGDGIPNNVIYVFTSSNCTFFAGDTTDAGDSLFVTVTGSVALHDTDDSDTFFGYNAAFGQWKYSITDGTTTIFVKLNGTSTADVGEAAVSGSDHYSITLNLDAANNATVSQNWDASFTPDVGQVVDSAAASLPPGEFDINGTFGFSGSASGQSGHWSFTLSTTNPLLFDPQCGEDNKLVGGSLQGAITAKNSVGFTVDFQDCGTLPTITAYDGTS
jgi:hypothetical protein